MNQNMQQAKPQYMRGFQMPPEPAGISSVSANSNDTTHNGATKRNPANHTPVLMTPSMVTAIKKSSKGKLPPGLAKYLASHKKGGKK